MNCLYQVQFNYICFEYSGRQFSILRNKILKFTYLLLFLHFLILLSISYLGNTVFFQKSFCMRHLKLKLSNASGFSDHNNHYFSLPLTLRESRQKVSVNRSTWLIVNFKLCSTFSNQCCLFRKAVKRKCFFRNNS